MRLKPYILLIILILTISGCAPQNKAAITGTEFVDTGGFFISYMDAFNSRDMNRLISHYAPNSLTYVLNDSGGYHLTQSDLYKAFEMKKEGWEKNNMRILDFTVLNTRTAGNLIDVSVEFKMQSSTWVGEYRTNFSLTNSGGVLKIFKENT